MSTLEKQAVTLNGRSGLCLLLMVYVLQCWKHNLFSFFPKNDANTRKKNPKPTSQADSLWPIYLAISKGHARFLLTCSTTTTDHRARIDSRRQKQASNTAQQHAYRFVGAVWCISGLVCDTKFRQAIHVSLYAHCQTSWQTMRRDFEGM